MAVRASVLPQPEPGHAILRLTELDASPDGLTISIQRQQGPDSHLADDGWRRTEAWLLPARVERVKGALDFHLGPEICDRLAGIATMRLRVKEPDIGVVGTTVVAWPTMLTSGAIDRGKQSLDDIVRLRRAKPEPPPPPAPPFEPPPKPAPELRAAREPMPEIERRSGATGWLIAAAILLLLAGGGYFAYTNYFQKNWPEALATAQPTPPVPAADDIEEDRARHGRRISRDQAHARGDAGQGQGVGDRPASSTAPSWCGGARPRRATCRPSSRSPASTIR